MQVQEQRDPSVFGVPLMQVFVGGLLFAALLYSRRDLILLCLLVLGLMFLARLSSRLSFGGIRSVSSLDRNRLFPGEALQVKFTAQNTRIIPAWLQITLAPADALVPLSSASDLARQSGLLWRQTVEFTFELTAAKRGIFPLGRSDLRIADPLGFFPRDKSTASNLEVVVYPKRVPIKVIPLPQRDFFGRPGAKNPVQDPVYILGTRNYQQGRPARHIHWKASARQHRLQEKVFEPSSQAKCLILLDAAPFAEEGAREAFERTLEVIGSLALALDRRGYAVGFAANASPQAARPAALPVERGPSQVSSILEILAGLRMQADGELLGILRRGFKLPSGLSCICFTRKRPEGSGSPLRQFLRLRNIPLACIASGGPSEEEGGGADNCWRLEDLTVPREALTK